MESKQTPICNGRRYFSGNIVQKCKKKELSKKTTFGLHIYVQMLFRKMSKKKQNKKRFQRLLKMDLKNLPQ